MHECRCEWLQKSAANKQTNIRLDFNTQQKQKDTSPYTLVYMYGKIKSKIKTLKSELNVT